jgi:hypothetical protein
MNDPLRIAVSGLAATYPFGGVFWDYIQYAYGLHLLGHDVLYVEDTGKWGYDPTAQTFVEDGAANAEYLRRHLSALDPALNTRWFYRDGGGQTYGKTWSEVVDFCKTADLFIHISASCLMRDEYLAAQRVAFIDSDPMYTQSSIPDYVAQTLDLEARGRVDMLRRHDAFFTFGENIGRETCLIPTAVFDWMPTRQPILSDYFAKYIAPVTLRRPVFTTVASWEPNEKGPVVNGVAYSGKSTEFLRFIDLPRHVQATLEIALSGLPPGPTARLEANGWNVIDAFAISSDPWNYREYLATSLGEWSVSKNAYSASRSGWFSCRTACYLALGVPAVVQNTGFADDIPTGRGLLAFDSIEEAADGIRQVLKDPQLHATAAREIAFECFDSKLVLSQLIDRAMTSPKRI